VAQVVGAEIRRAGVGRGAVCHRLGNVAAILISVEEGDSSREAFVQPNTGSLDTLWAIIAPLEPMMKHSTVLTWSCADIFWVGGSIPSLQLALSYISSSSA
jgi:hypothetical protein